MSDPRDDEAGSSVFSAEPGPGAPSGPGRPAGAGRRRLSVLGISGEALITVGVLVLLFLGWQVWWSSLISNAAQTKAASEQSQEWIKKAKAATPPRPVPTQVAGADPVDPPVMQPVANYQPFAVIYIPRLGSTWQRVIRETVDVDQVLDSFTAGVGHYPGTAMPGQIGNFAIAGHDTGWGNAFINLQDMQLGDPIYIQTSQGWYTYQFRNGEYVQPTQVDVLLPVPQDPSATATMRLMTITTCNPRYHGTERYAAFATFQSYQPLSAGPPAGIAGEVQAQAG
jgi:sortase A